MVNTIQENICPVENGNFQQAAFNLVPVTEFYLQVWRPVDRSSRQYEKNFLTWATENGVTSA